MRQLVGKKAPAFKTSAIAGNGESFFDLALEEYKSNWLLLLFYPPDFTEITWEELTTTSRIYPVFKATNCEVLAVGAESQYSHQKWIQDHLGKINFPLAADRAAQIAADYGLHSEDEEVPLRGLFLLDADQVIRYSSVHDWNVAGNIEETYRMLRALQTGKPCGVSWRIEAGK